MAFLYCYAPLIGVWLVRSVFASLLMLGSLKRYGAVVAVRPFRRPVGSARAFSMIELAIETEDGPPVLTIPEPLGDGFRVGHEVRIARSRFDRRFVCYRPLS